VYKPKEWSSSDVVGKVRNILRNGAKKAANKRAGKVNIKVGHGGTLDPLAEGVLVLGIGEGTKLLQQYLTGPKSYHAVGLLGSETDTLDSTGTVTSTAEWDHISHTTIDEALGMFRGEIMQVPPMYVFCYTIVLPSSSCL
jgi:tRNA pseudouridine55 synthase